MNASRAFVSGVLVWACTLTTFIGMEALLPGQLPLQASLACVLLVGYAGLAARFYYRTGRQDPGWKVGAVMSLAALSMDVLVTVPFYEIPHGRTYGQFFTDPLLWALVAINLLTVTAYGQFKVKRAVQR